MTTDSTPSVVLTPEEGRSLIRLARLTIAERLNQSVDEDKQHRLEEELQKPVFTYKCGTFVTLTKKGQLRGCIGSLGSTVSLVENIRQNAISAAFQDPRFSPLTREEYHEVRIEVSVLTPPLPVRYDSADHLLDLLRPGTDGVILRKGGASATFLPQVWKQLPRQEDFLSHLCLKAGLSAQAWRRGNLEVETYQVQYFEEED